MRMASLAAFVVGVVAVGLPARAADSPGAPAENAAAPAAQQDTNQIKELTAEEARQLVAHHAKPTLSLDGLTAISDDAARSLAGFRGRYLKLNGLANASDEAVRALAEFKGEALFLDGLTKVSDAQAAALGAFKGNILSLNGLTAISDAQAEALASYSGHLKLDGLIRLSPEALTAFSRLDKNRLITGKRVAAATTHTPDSARVFVGLAVPRRLTSSNLAALDSPDAVEVAKIFAAAEGPLNLRRLYRVSRPALEALVEKKDLLLPALDTLEITAGDDVVIPDGFEERQAVLRGGTLAVAWHGGEIDNELLGVAPETGFIADQATFSKVWAAWSKEPDRTIDFRKYFVVIETWNAADRNIRSAVITADPNGVATLSVRTTNMNSPHSNRSEFTLHVVPRKDIKAFKRLSCKDEKCVETVTPLPEPTPAG